MEFDGWETTELTDDAAGVTEGEEGAVKTGSFYPHDNTTKAIKLYHTKINAAS